MLQKSFKRRLWLLWSVFLFSCDLKHNLKTGKLHEHLNQFKKKSSTHRPLKKVVNVLNCHIVIDRRIKLSKI